MHACVFDGCEMFAKQASKNARITTDLCMKMLKEGLEYFHIQRIDF